MKYVKASGKRCDKSIVTEPMLTSQDITRLFTPPVSHVTKELQAYEWYGNDNENGAKNNKDLFGTKC